MSVAVRRCSPRIRHHIQQSKLDRLSLCFVHPNPTTTTGVFTAATNRFMFFMCNTQSNDQSKRYNALGSQCRQLTPGSDLVAFARSLTPFPTTPYPSQRSRNYCPPQAPADTEGMVLDPVVTASHRLYIATIHP